MAATAPWESSFDSTIWDVPGSDRADDAYEALSPFLLNPSTRKRKPADLKTQVDSARADKPLSTRRLFIKVSLQAWFALYAATCAINGSGNVRPRSDDAEIMRLFHELDPSARQGVAERLTRLKPHQTVQDELRRWLGYGETDSPTEPKPTKARPRKRKRETTESPAAPRAKALPKTPAKNEPETPATDASPPDTEQTPQSTQTAAAAAAADQVFVGADMDGLKEIFTASIVDAVAEIRGPKGLVAMGQLGPAPPDCVLSLAIEPDKVAGLAQALFRTQVICDGNQRYLVLDSGPVPVTMDEIYLRRGHGEAIVKVLGKDVARAVSQSVLGQMDNMQTGTRSVTMSFEKDIHAPGFLNLCLGGSERQRIIRALYPAQVV